MLLLANLAPRGYTAAEVSKRAGTTLVTVLGDPSSEPRLLGKVLARSGASAVAGAVCDDDELRCYIVDDPLFFAQTCASGGGDWRDRWP